MKRIVTKSEDTVTLCDIEDTSIVGIKWECGCKGMIISTEEGFCSLNNRNKPNLWNVWYAASTREYVEKALRQGNNTKSKAFVFDTTYELYKWMSE